jgi:mono/diheme cytochrome c family protein
MLRLLGGLFISCLIAGCSSQSTPEPVSVRTEDPVKGAKLFNEAGCAACHSFNGEMKYGPQLGSILNREVEVIRKGNRIKVKADREYLLRSLKNPDYEKVVGYQKRKMPELDLSQESIECLVDYLVSVNKSASVDSLRPR